MRYKLFVGPKVRQLRARRGWRLEACAQKLGISVSYLSQIEANQRPVTDRVLVGLIETFEVPAATFEADEGQRLVADLREAVADTGTGEEPIPLSELRQIAQQAPALARRFLDLHRANHRLAERLKLTEEAVSLDEATAAVRSSLRGGPRLLPLQGQLHRRPDRAAEDLAQEIGLTPRARPTC